MNLSGDFNKDESEGEESEEEESKEEESKEEESKEEESKEEESKEEESEEFECFGLSTRSYKKSKPEILELSNDFSVRENISFSKGDVDEDEDEEYEDMSLSFCETSEDVTFGK